jgi:myo-inositol-hexaphosphate 3-phosphohydrolase
MAKKGQKFHKKDLETRDWVVYIISKYNDNRLVINTLKEAIIKIKDLSGLVLHSNQDFRYLSTEYKKYTNQKV